MSPSQLDTSDRRAKQPPLSRGGVIRRGFVAGYVKQLNYSDPRHRHLDTDQHTPGNQGPTWSGRPRVPAGETLSRNPQIGLQTPLDRSNP